MAETWPKRITVYATLHYEYLYDRGRELGLSERAADYFAHFEEAPLVIDVAEDGSVTIVPQQEEQDPGRGPVAEAVHVAQFSETRTAEQFREPHGPLGIC